MNSNKPSILIVDDNFVNLYLIEQYLTNNEYEIISAMSGNEVFEKTKEKKYDLILLDIMMPDISGFEVCKKLKKDENTKDIPVIFISALFETEDKIKAFEVGGVDYITKPIDQGELIVRVKTHITISILRDNLLKTNNNLENVVKERTQELVKVNKLLEKEIKTKEQVIIKLLEQAQRIEENQKKLFLSESRLKQAQSVAGIGMWEWIPGTTDFFLSDEIYSIFEIHPDALNNRAEIFKYVHPDDREKIENDLNDVFKSSSLSTSILLEKEQFHKLYDFKILCPNDRIKYIQSRIYPIFEKNNHLVCVQGVLWDNTERHETELKILNAIIETEEREKQSFAQDLHDDLGPFLSSIRLYINQLESSINEDQRSKHINQLKCMLAEAIQITRNISNRLMPNLLYDYGLIKAVNSFVGKINSSGQISVNLNTNSIDFGLRLEINTEIILYRIITELINNTIKHAHADSIFIELSLNKHTLKLEYRDNGKGFDFEGNRLKNKGMGLSNIVHRLKTIDGYYDFHSEAGEGMQFIAKVKIRSPHELK